MLAAGGEEAIEKDGWRNERLMDWIEGKCRGDKEMGEREWKSARAGS